MRRTTHVPNRFRNEAARTRWSYAVPIVFSVLWALPGAQVCGQEPPVLEWDYASGRLQDQRLSPRAGAHVARTLGAVRLAGEPSRLEFEGGRAVVAEDIAKCELPIRSITLRTWVRVDRVGPWCGMLSAIQDNGAFERGWLLGCQNGRFCFGLVTDSKKRITYLASNDALALGAWYHVAATYDGETMRLFVDGVLAAESKAQSGPILYPQRGVVSLGAYVDDNETYPLQGALAETAIFSSPLSAEAIQKHFTAGKAKYPHVDVVAPSIVGWPTYMHDDARSGVTLEKAPPPLHLHWAFQTARKPEPAWPPPAQQNFWAGKMDLKARVTFDRAFHVVSDGRRVYFGSSADDQVRALDLESGELVWSFFCEGPVRLAPTLAEGRVVFGSDDGRVYCLDAESGRLEWSFLAAAERRRIIPGNGRLMSTFPVRTGVVVHDHVVRFGAGLFPNQGAYQFALDLKTGDELATGKLGFSPQGYLRRVGGKLQIAQGRAPDTDFSNASRKSKGKTVSLAVGKRSERYPFAWIRAGDHHFGGGDGEVASFASNLDEPIWKAPIEGRAYSLAVAGGRLLVSTDAGWIYCFGAEARPLPHTTSGRAAPLPGADPADRRQALNWAESIATLLDIPTGYILVLGGGELEAWALSQRTGFRIIVLQSDATRVRQMRERLHAAGLYGRVVVQAGPQSLRKFGSNLFNLVVVAESGDVWSQEEVARLVRPAGGLLLDLTTAGAVDSVRSSRLAKWKSLEASLAPIESGDLSQGGTLALRRPSLAGQGEWTHMYGNPQNTSCSDDKIVQGELQLQWFGPPGPRQMVDRHHRATAPLSVNGMLFVPGNECLFGVDAYNGSVYWTVDLANFRRVGAPRDGGNMAASPDTLYAVAKDRCYAFAAQDGAQRGAFAAPVGDDGSQRDWGFVAVVDDRLYGSSTRPGASRSDHRREQISETYYDFVSIVTSDSVFCRDRTTGELCWRYKASGAILNPTLTLGGGRFYFVESRDSATLDPKHQGRVKLSDFLRQGADLVALDQGDGTELWRAKVDFAGVQHHLFLAYAKEKLVTVGTRNAKVGSRENVHYDLAAFDAGTGAPVWSATQDQGQPSGGSHGEQDHHLAIVGDEVLQEPYSYNLHTGERRKDWRFARGGHGCGSISASASAFFYRAGNPTMCDLATGERRKVNAVSRPGCWINMIPAGGMLLIPEASSGCTCNFAIQSSMAFAPREEAAGPRERSQ